MSQGGTQGGSTTVGLPKNSTAPGMGGLGIGGGIYGNPFQVNQLSQPNALQGGKGGMGQMGQGIGSNTVPEWAKPYIGEVMQKSPLLGQMQDGPQQSSVLYRAPFYGQGNDTPGAFQQPGMGLGALVAPPTQPYQNASMFQGRGAMLNQPQGMNSAGLGSLIPRDYASQR